MEIQHWKEEFNSWKLESGPAWAFFSGVESFWKNETALRASALTYYTALAVVPVFAILFGISRGFGILEDVDAMAAERFSEHQQVYEFARDSAQQLLQNGSGGFITSVAILFLLWTVINILSQVETELNRIWRTNRSRSLLRRVTDYTALIILLPLLMVTGSGVTMWLLHGTGPIASHFGVKVLPTASTCVVLFLSYLLLPSRRIPYSTAFIAAVVAGLAYQVVQFIFIRFQVGVSTYSTLYGSFAAIPLFLVWVQVSWMIVLAGAELGYAWQYRGERAAVMRARCMSRRERSCWAILMAAISVKRFASGKPCPNKKIFVNMTGLPESQVEEILDDLLEGGILWRATKRPGLEACYAPARPVDVLRVSDVLAAVLGAFKLPEPQDLPSEVSEAVNSLWMAALQHPANTRLVDLSLKEV